MIVWFNWSAVFLFLILTIILVGLTISAGSFPVMQTLGAPGRGVKMEVVRQNFPPMAPLWWDNYEGAYMISLFVGKGLVELVLDSGCSQLSVKGEGCQWKNCTELGCAIMSCPCGFENGQSRKQCKEWFYQPSGQPIDRSGKLNELKYGSQTNRVQYYQDEVFVPITSKTMTCDTVMRTPDLREIPQFRDKVRVGEILVHRVSHIEGASNSNLLGCSKPKAGKNDVLDNLLPKKIWSVVLYKRGGWLALGRMPCFQPEYITMIEPPSLMSFVTRFYILPIFSISIGPDELSLHKLPSFPKYCIIDTGTTSTYASKTFGAALANGGFKEGPNGSCMEIQLGSTSNHVRLFYSRTALMDPEYPAESIIQAWQGRTLDDFDEIFPDDNQQHGVLLFGAIMMQDHYWEFDLQKNRIGIS